MACQASIIIPAYNEEKYIFHCLASVFLLKKTVDFEVIVVNNASIDRTPEIVKNNFPQVKLINENRRGLSIAYNRGAKEAKGEILVFIDADVVLPPNHLEKILKEFNKNPKLVALSGPYLYKDGGFFPKFTFLLAVLFIAMPAEFIFNRFLNLGASMTSGNSAIKKESLKKVKGFNEKIFYGLDTDLALRIRKMGKVRYKFYLLVESSARRLKKEGVLKILIRYFLNVVWAYFFSRPFTKDHINVR